MSNTQRLGAEAFGTFWLVLGGCGTAVLAGEVMGTLGISFAFGLTVLTMAFAVGHISGGHFNPAVTIGLWAGKRFESRDVAPYVVAQLVGAVLAGAVLLLIANGIDGFDPSTGKAGSFATNGYGDFSPAGYSLLACFVCEVVTVRVETSDTPFTYGCRRGELLELPIKHGEGCWVADEDTLTALEADGQVVFRYADRAGRSVPEANPNGSLGNVAGVCNPGRNVVGLMPHPEHAVDRWVGGEDGLKLFRSVQAWLGSRQGGARREPTVVPGP